jgi:uncharacterized protein YbjT (DUF2867 family)
MKIVVIGGSGLIGRKLVPILRERGHEAVSASPSSGVNAVSGEGLAEALAGANVVVDVSNSPSWADDAVMEFFDKSTRNLLAAEKTAGVGHHVALSVVGADRMTDSGYMRAKVHQEGLIEAGGVPFTIVRATQFFEFLGGIAGNGDGDIRLPTAPMQPLAADDVASALADIAPKTPAASGRSRSHGRSRRPRSPGSWRTTGEPPSGRSKPGSMASRPTRPTAISSTPSASRRRTIARTNTAGALRIAIAS